MALGNKAAKFEWSGRQAPAKSSAGFQVARPQRPARPVRPARLVRAEPNHPAARFDAPCFAASCAWPALKNREVELLPSPFEQSLDVFNSSENRAASQRQIEAPFGSSMLRKSAGTSTPEFDASNYWRASVAEIHRRGIFRRQCGALPDVEYSPFR